MQMDTLALNEVVQQDMNAGNASPRHVYTHRLARTFSDL
jgi:hypothetical protein